MNPKEKAEELVEKYKDYVCGYIGSSMLTNTEYPEQILKQAKQCAIIAIDELINEHTFKFPLSWNVKRLGYWKQVKSELEKM